MKRLFPNQHIAILLSLSLLLTPFLLFRPAQAQEAQVQPERGRGRTLRSYRVNQTAASRVVTEQQEKRPDWVETARQRALGLLNEQTRADKLAEAAPELELQGVDEDDFGLTHVRLEQKHNGVTVFGGQLIAHLDQQTLRSVSGRVFAATRLNTNPSLDEAQAIAAAQAALAYAGEFAAPPSATLVVLPHHFFKEDDAPGATLVYRVALSVKDGTAATGHHLYFVNAHDGSIVWYYDGLARGTGHSLYSGTVHIPTTHLPTNFVTPRLMIDPDGGSSTRDSEYGDVFADDDDVWGNGQASHRQTAAVDVHFGVRLSREYFYYALGRWGVDGNGAGITSYVHYRRDGKDVENAYGDRNSLAFGDGIASTSNPWVTVDVVGHEYTHALIDHVFWEPSVAASGMIYAKESGAIEESFADIFGTAVEFYSNRNPDYLIGEGIRTNGTALRDMAAMAHYSQRYPTNGCMPAESNDFCGVHTNSGIMNKAFQLLAEGGLHTGSNVYVPRIGRDVAERIFYRALTTYLTPGAQFRDAAAATIAAAAEPHYGFGSATHQAVARAWAAVGVVDFPASYYKLVAKHSGKALEIENFYTHNSAPVVQYDYWGGDNQRWSITPAGDGYFKITVKHTGKALELKDYLTHNSAPVVQYDYWGGDNQKWLLIPTLDGHYVLMAKHSRKALELKDYLTHNWAPVVQYDYWGGDNQKWKITATSLFGLR